MDEYTNEIKSKKIDDKEIDIDSVIIEVLMFDNKIFNEFDEFRKKIESQIEIKSSDYNGEYNRFKKCPHCGIIWFKIIGCNSIICGNRTKAEDKIVGKYKKYTVTYVNNKVVIESEEQGEDLEKKNKKYDLSEIPIFSIRDERINQFRRIRNDNEILGLTPSEKTENEEREKKGKIKINPVGCGKPSK